MLSKKVLEKKTSQAAQNGVLAILCGGGSRRCWRQVFIIIIFTNCQYHHYHDYHFPSPSDHDPDNLAKVAPYDHDNHGYYLQGCPL